METTGRLMMEPEVHLDVIAGIVHDLLICEPSQQRDQHWLSARAGAEELNKHERAAIEALRQLLSEKGAWWLESLAGYTW